MSEQLPHTQRDAKPEATKNLELFVRDRYADPRLARSGEGASLARAVDGRSSENDPARVDPMAAAIALDEAREVRTRKGELERLSVTQLMSEAAKRHIANRSSMTRRELINALARAS